MNPLKVLIVVILFVLPGRAFVELEDRQPVTMEGGLLTPFWAQEYIGADLVKEEMRMMPGLSRVPVAVYDVGFEKEHINLTSDIYVDRAMNGSRPMKGHHGTSVVALINGAGMMSVSEMVDYVQLKRVSPAVFYSSAVREIKELPRKPRVISNSMGWKSDSVLELAREVDQLGIIWVMAAGNDHPEKIVEHERVAPVVSVGSFSPRGLQTLSSQESDQLDILAPADEYQASIDGNGHQVLFGETSGATPLVSGTIINFVSFLPELTRAQAETILKATAFRAFHSYYSQENKAGLLNSYKAFKVVERLRERCGPDAACVDRELQENETYRFSVDLPDDKVRAICKSREVLEQDQMKRLRRQQLLSDDAEYSRLLGCAYRNEGYTINADFYFNLWMIQKAPQMLQRKIQKLAVEAIQQGNFQSAALRDPAILDEEYRSALEKSPEYSAKLLLEAYNRAQRINVRP